MSKQARIVNSVAVDVVIGDPAKFFHPDIAKDFVPVPDEVQAGWQFVGGQWQAPVIPDPVVPVPVAPIPPKVSPVEFKLLFTSPERIVIKAARATDPVLADAYEILEDPRLTEVDLALQSNIDLIDYMVTLALVTPERAVVIKTGKIL